MTCWRVTVRPAALHASAMSRPETDPFGDSLGLVASLQVLRLELHALLLETSKILLAGAHRLLLRQQVVAGETGFYPHPFAHLSQLLDALEQDQFHGGHGGLLRSGRRAAGRGNARA
jgi:hypothetical protein